MRKRVSEAVGGYAEEASRFRSSLDSGWGPSSAILAGPRSTAFVPLQAPFKCEKCHQHDVQQYVRASQFIGGTVKHSKFLVLSVPPVNRKIEVQLSSRWDISPAQLSQCKRAKLEGYPDGIPWIHIAT